MIWWCYTSICGRKSGILGWLSEFFIIPFYCLFVIFIMTAERVISTDRVTIIYLNKLKVLRERTIFNREMSIFK
jgi:hypothetical protein